MGGGGSREALALRVLYVRRSVDTARGRTSGGRSAAGRSVAHSNHGLEPSGRDDRGSRPGGSVRRTHLVVRVAHARAPPVALARAATGSLALYIRSVRPLVRAVPDRVHRHRLRGKYLPRWPPPRAIPCPGPAPL